MFKIRNPFKKREDRKRPVKSENLLRKTDIGIGELLWKSINHESEGLHWNEVPAWSVCKNEPKVSKKVRIS